MGDYAARLIAHSGQSGVSGMSGISQRRIQPALALDSSVAWIF
jgi:hypothetical protein